MRLPNPTPAPRQTSVQLIEMTERQAAELQASGFGTFTDVVRIAIDRMYQQEKRTMELSQTEQNAALEIAKDVIEDGRVLTTQRGTLNKESLRVEVSFEASERGYDAVTAEAMGKYAAKQ